MEKETIKAILNHPTTNFIIGVIAGWFFNSALKFHRASKVMKEAIAMLDEARELRDKALQEFKRIQDFFPKGDN